MAQNDAIDVPTIGMETRLREGRLFAKAEKGNKQWVAVLSGPDPKYTFDREFVAYQKPKTSKRASGTVTLDGPTILESVRFTHSGKNRKTRYHRVVPETGEVEELTKEDVVLLFDREDRGENAPTDDTDDDAGDTEEIRTDGGQNTDTLRDLSDRDLAHDLAAIRKELSRRGENVDDPANEFLYEDLADRLDDVILRVEAVAMARSGDGSLDDMLNMVDEVGRQADALADRDDEDDDQDPEIRTDGGQDTDAHSEPVPLTRHRNVSDGLAECGQCDRLYSTVVNPLRCPACGDPRRRTRAYAGP